MSCHSILSNGFSRNLASAGAAYGTAYGVTVIAKVALFAILLLLGALNFFILRSARADAASLFSRLRRFAEAEVGIGFTVILAAASLTSQPPATDMTSARVSLAEIVERMTPRWPRLQSPAAAELSIPSWQIQRQAALSGFTPQSYVPGAAPAHPNTPADMAWSEYNHHRAGVVVLMIGLLALAARSGRAPWARNWPLLFAALAVFLFFRSDPESWTVGMNGFWESFADSEIVQHRAFVALIIAFAVFEWRVQTGRLVSARAAQVFPLVCGLGGALLLTHSHALGNVKEELLAEWSHVPLALMVFLAGGSRWLELRLAGKPSRILSLIWPTCFVLTGVVLLLYRES
jgi:putative copper resistance protein D